MRAVISETPAKKFWIHHCDLKKQRTTEQQAVEEDTQEVEEWREGHGAAGGGGGLGVGEGFGAEGIKKQRTTEQQAEEEDSLQEMEEHRQLGGRNRCR